VASIGHIYWVRGIWLLLKTKHHLIPQRQRNHGVQRICPILLQNCVIDEKAYKDPIPKTMKEPKRRLKVHMTDFFLFTWSNLNDILIWQELFHSMPYKWVISGIPVCLVTVLVLS